MLDNIELYYAKYKILWLGIGEVQRNFIYQDDNKGDHNGDNRDDACLSHKLDNHQSQQGHERLRRSSYSKSDTLPTIKAEKNSVLLIREYEFAETTDSCIWAIDVCDIRISHCGNECSDRWGLVRTASIHITVGFWPWHGNSAPSEKRKVPQLPRWVSSNWAKKRW